MSKKKNELLKEVMKNQAIKHLDDPKEIELALESLDKLGDNGFLEMSVSKLTKDIKFLTKLLTAQENLINLVTNCLSAMENKNPSIFRERICDLTDGLKFSIGGSVDLDETDEVGRVLKCVYNDVLWDMHKKGSKALKNVHTGLECLDMIVNCPEDMLEKMAKKFNDRDDVDLPDDIKEEIKKATRSIKKGGTTYDA